MLDIVESIAKNENFQLTCPLKNEIHEYSLPAITSAHAHGMSYFIKKGLLETVRLCLIRRKHINMVFFRRKTDADASELASFNTFKEQQEKQQESENNDSDRYVWIGAVTQSSFSISIDMNDDEQQILIAKDEKFENIVQTADYNSNTNKTSDVRVFRNLRSYNIQNLEPGTKYVLGLRTGTGDKHIGSIRTFTSENKSREIMFAFGSCQRGYNRSESLAEIALWREAMEERKPAVPFLFIHMGDLHYSDIVRNDVALFEDAHRRTVAEFNASKLFRTTPVVYMWDDHDFGANNSDSKSESKPAAFSAYKNMIPSYPTQEDSIYQAFTVANVRFILTDVRSEAIHSEESMISKSQQEFLYHELKQWEKFDVVVWMSTRPWIDKPKKGADSWGGFQIQRREIANFIAKNKINNLMLISGDAHMLAVDDGTNSAYADEEYSAQGFPVFQAAPLAGFGTVKGGPYSHGVRTQHWRMNRQYGLMSINPIPSAKGTLSEISFKGYRILGKNYAKDTEELLSKEPIIEYKTRLPREWK